jgi:hypothetical protein
VTLATAALASGHPHPKRPLSVFTPRVNNGDTGFVPVCQSRRVCCRVASATQSRLRPCAGDATADVLERLPDGTVIEALEGYSLGWPSGAAGGVAGA